MLLHIHAVRIHRHSLPSRDVAGSRLQARVCITEKQQVSKNRDDHTAGGRRTAYACFRLSMCVWCGGGWWGKGGEGGGRGETKAETNARGKERERERERERLVILDLT